MLLKCQSNLKFHRGGKLPFPCPSEDEPEVQALLVSDVTPDSFRLAWMAEEDVFDTFVIMVSQPEGPGKPRELVLGGEEQSAAMTELNEDTEYKIEIFGLVLGRRSKSVIEGVRTGTQLKNGTKKRAVKCGLVLLALPVLSFLSFMVTA